MRLWLDELSALTPLAPDHSAIEVRLWGKDFPEVRPAQIVIEAFACELPDNYVAAMAQQTRPPVWINLEYLCVEAWGKSIHLQPSPHPRLPLTKYFFVPGPLPGLGGLLCESDLFARRAAFARPADAALQVFLFSYENPALPDLLDTWAHNPQPIHCRVAAGKAATEVARWLGTNFAPGSQMQRGALQLSALPFVTQNDFDALLWASDLNFVRGEDSFARAQWAALPFIWHIYPQQENAHFDKLNAFNQAYSMALPEAARTALLTFSALWNGQTISTPATMATAWAELCNALPQIKQGAENWKNTLKTHGNLAGNLAIFCKKL